eukprot:TRINITY_DN11053_c0_g2_i1.p1 TRINITY_DN11053_c0_g2~~TRINITY_DN11053_c0_g2_i1.p1  ORF type:complete len:584 (+),score=71.52 TRINITY_DN11053_c0_g2_i1:2997-4748(+)
MHLIAKAYLIKLTLNNTCTCLVLKAIGLISVQKTIEAVSMIVKKWLDEEPVGSHALETNKLLRKKERKILDILELEDELERVDQCKTPRITSDNDLRWRSSEAELLKEQLPSPVQPEELKEFMLPSLAQPEEYPEIIGIPSSQESSSKDLSLELPRRQKFFRSDPGSPTNQLEEVTETEPTMDRDTASADDSMFLADEKVSDDLRRNSCMLDYVYPNYPEPTPKPLHKRSMSDHTLDIYNTDSSASISTKYSIKDFEFVKAINSGSFGKICLVRMKSTGEVYAMKIINSEEAVASNREEYVASEWEVFRKVNSEHIVRCYYTFYYSKYLCFVMEYMNGGDLSFLIDKFTLYEPEAKFYLAELVLALEYLHNKGIVHRDIKPANVLIGSDGHVKLCDFGLAMCSFARNGLLIKECENSCPTKRVGTVYYMSPEVVKENSATPDVDWWALGVVAFEMLLGKLPYSGDTVEKIFENIVADNRESYGVGQGEDEISLEADSLLKGLLEPEPKKRLGHEGAGEIKKHPFFAGINWETIRSSNPPFLPINKEEDPTFYFSKDCRFSLEEFIEDSGKCKTINETSKVSQE